MTTGTWQIDWYVNMEFMLQDPAIFGTQTNYFQFGIASQIGNNPPVVLSNTIRKAYGTNPFPSSPQYQEGFVEGTSIITVTNPSERYFVVFYRGPSIDIQGVQVSQYGKIEFIPIDNDLVFFQQGSITFRKLANL